MIAFSHTKHGNELLNLLLSANRYLSLQELGEHLKLSRRSVFYVLKKVNTELEESNLDPIQQIRNIGYYLTPSTASYLNENKSSSNFKLELKLNRFQRQQFIVWKLINCEKVSLFTITSTFKISKNTAICDLKNINTKLKKYGLKLVKSKEGRKIQGEEVLQRNWVYEQLSKHNSLIYSQLPNDPSKLSQINAYLHQLEKATGNYLTDDALMTTSTFILWYLNRVKNPDNLLVDIHENYGFKDSKGLNCTKNFLSENGILNESEAHYLMKIINSSQFSKINQEDLTIKKLIPITRAIVDRFNQLAGVDIPPENLEISLTTHLFSTYNRVKYNISYKHPNLEQIEVEYHQLFTLTKYAIKYFEDFISRRLSNDEIALIALYFGSELRKLEEKKLLKETPEVFIVCSSGIGTSTALKQELHSRYPLINFSSPMSVVQYESSSLLNVKLIISTIDLRKRKDIPIIQVSAIPNESDWNRITQALSKVGLNSTKKSQINTENLLDIISNYARIENVSGLKKSLENYFNKVENTKNITPKNNTELRDLVFESHLMIYKEDLDWEKAIHLTYEPLIRENIVSERYINEIINLTKNHGPYMVLGKGIMLAHAKPSDGVISLGLSVFLSKHSIYIPNLKGKKTAKVNLIIGLAPVDSVSHLKALSNLTNKIQDSNWLDSIYKCTNKKQLKELLLI